MNQINQINKTNQINQIAIGRGAVEVMSQDMVARSLSDIDLSTAANGNVGQAPRPYTPKMLLLKMPYRFNTGYQLLTCSGACMRWDWFLSP